MGADSERDVHVSTCGRQISLNLLVLRCRDIEASKVFYETLGHEFVAERHGNGPRHYAAKLGGLVLELYPRRGNESPDDLRLGFSCPTLVDIAAKIRTSNIPIINELREIEGRLVLVVRDPDGRSVELSQPLLSDKT